ncbi:MAG: export ABC transporter ATP-binding protein [Firmicutes bacterium HGW-Firmicutes-1]|jgi:ABC-2 type transport system ATP-binding protein|nr:MAG: export ABC transporter ATP-binding protein [Firmicutes bacterium HGW-Firmicutes-1]
MELLKVQNISKQFKKVKAVDGISFTLKKGEILGLLGPNGAGKSTTISMISTLIQPDSGEILYADTSILSKPKVIQESLGYVPQEIALYPMLSGKENLVFWGRAYGLKGQKLKDKIEEISEIIGIKDRLKDKVKTYSGGMKRRLNIGVALLHDPELIIMDEPTVGIDPQSRKHILDTVLELNKKGMTVIYTSHYMEEVEYLCNRICIMDQGKIIAEGTKEQLIEQHNSTKDIKLKLSNYSQEVLKKIEALDCVISLSQLEEEIIVKATQDKKVFKNIVDLLNDDGVDIHSMDIDEANLETVFLQLTGRILRD